jgi:hypothetical protein
MKFGLWLVAALIVAPLVFSAARLQGQTIPWYEQRRDSSGQAPDPAATHEAVLQVYAARTVGWRGVFAVHTWIIVKPTGAARYTRYEVVGFGVSDTVPAIRLDRAGPDNYWFGAKPDKLLDLRGANVDALIAKVKTAIDAYPYPHTYVSWPGPNSNTFIAWIARQVPELRLELPSIAIGKDFLGVSPAAMAPSGTGVQLSVLGLAGAMAALDEGVEVNVLGLVLGVDVARPALKLPLIGRVGWPKAQAQFPEPARMEARSEP